jgi:hypothetical protein
LAFISVSQRGTREHGASGETAIRIILTRCHRRQRDYHPVG